MKLYIKNMTCESCKIFVKDVLQKLGLSPIYVELGEVKIQQEIPDLLKNELNAKIQIAGLELLEKRRDILIDQIRKVMIAYVFNTEIQPNLNFSDLLSKELGHSYNYLANIFSEEQDITIEQYIIALKIERTKEMILLDEDSISEIAYKLNYCSVAHLSSQFKKVTGLTPSQFKSQKVKSRIPLQLL